jgi:hypothetical protein
VVPTLADPKADFVLERIAGCSDETILDRWVVRALTASSANDAID